MTSPMFRLRVDRIEGGRFVWVISEVSEVSPSMEETELASSLNAYESARQAFGRRCKGARAKKRPVAHGCHQAV